MSHDCNAEQAAWQKKIRLLWLWQSVTGVIGAVFSAAWISLVVGLSVLYGSGLGVLIGWFLASPIAKAGETDVLQGQNILYLAAIKRFVVVIAALFLAHGLGLHLLAVAGGFFLAQVVTFIYGFRMAKQAIG